MAERLTLAVEDGTRDKLIALAGSERKIGAAVSQLVSDAYEVQQIQRSLATAVWELLERVQRLEASIYGGE